MATRWFGPAFGISEHVDIRKRTPLVSRRPVVPVWQLANWIVDGEPSVDMIGVDPRRFGVVTKHFTKLKNEEAYSHVFVNHFPMEERPAGRGARTIPVHQKLLDAGAVMGARFGWETAKLVRQERGVRASTTTPTAARTGGSR